MIRYLCLAAALLGAQAAAAPRWEMRYFYDENRSTLAISDLRFPSPRRGVAIGAIEEKDKTRGVAVVTSDGGAHWSLVPLKEIGLSVYFLNDTLGWMVTAKGVWQSDEGGRSWRKLPGTPKGILRVHFLDPRHGYAAGLKKSVWETQDGGKQWTRVAAADEPKANADYTAYTTIAFATPKVGIISGLSQPPRRSDSGALPDWLEPEKAARRRVWPHMSINLETRDGGQHWSVSTASVFGRVMDVSLTPEGRGLALFEFSGSFQYPSEVYELNLKTGKPTLAYRNKIRAVTDVALIPSGPGYLAAVAATGELLRTPIPGKLKMLRSDDLANWKEMEVDYRATARRAVLAAADARNIWVATDTGMILKLEE